MITPQVSLPVLPAPDVLADFCREAGAVENLDPAMVEKDFYLSRLLWAMGQVLGPGLLLKGGTLLSKADLTFRRMSEDADFVMPGPPGKKASNARRMNTIREALKATAAAIGIQVPYIHGERADQESHGHWDLKYPSEFGQQGILLEVTIRPVLKPARAVTLHQLLADPSVGDYSPASCWALDAAEARAEKVRAAFTREAIRDFYDLEELRLSGADLTSVEFRALVDAKLAELGAPPLSRQPRLMGLTGSRRTKLESSLAKDLPAVLRSGSPAFDLHAVVERLDQLWLGTFPP